MPYCHITCQVLLYFFTLSHKWHDFRIKLLNIKCAFWFSLQLSSETFLILRITERDTIKKFFFHVKHPFLSSDLNETWFFSTDFQNILKYQISWKSVHRKPSCSMWADWRTDMTKLIVTSLNSAKAPKSWLIADVGQYTYTAKWHMIQHRLMVLFRHFRSSMYKNVHSLTVFSLEDGNSV